MREKSIEKRLKSRVSEKSGLCDKIFSPGTNGMPDRLVIFPGGKMVFVECKAPGEKLRKLQEYRIGQLRDLGVKVYIVDSYEAVEDFIREEADGL